MAFSIVTPCKNKGRIEGLTSHHLKQILRLLSNVLNRVVNFEFVSLDKSCELPSDIVSLLSLGFYNVFIDYTTPFSSVLSVKLDSSKAFVLSAKNFLEVLVLRLQLLQQQ